MKEMDIQILKYRTLQGQYLQANNMVVSLKQALEAANAESQNLRELRKADLCQISNLESELTARDNTIREKDEEIERLKADLADARAQNEQMEREKEDIVKESEEAKELLSLSKEASVDLKNIVGLLQLRMFSKNSDSNIRIFTADRAKLYETITNDLEKHYGIKVTRTACWFHARHYFCDAFVSDKRVRPIIELMNYLFYIERYAKSHNYTFEQRLNYRLRYSRKVVTTIMKTLERMKNDKKAKYGRLVMRAINYVLDDREAFQVFLTDGMVEIHNIAIERCFRHIANGRRNWQQAGSHVAAENLAFMYSLYESCKMNNLNFGRYIEDILTRMKDGDEDYLSMLPCYYKAPEIKVEECA